MTQIKWVKTTDGNVIMGSWVRLCNSNKESSVLLTPSLVFTRHNHVPPGAVKVDESSKEEGEDDHHTKTDDWEHSWWHDHVHWWGLVYMVWSMGRLSPIVLRRGVGQDDGSVNWDNQMVRYSSLYQGIINSSLILLVFCCDHPGLWSSVARPFLLSWVCLRKTTGP